MNYLGLKISALHKLSALVGDPSASSTITNLLGETFEAVSNSPRAAWSNHTVPFAFIAAGWEQIASLTVKCSVLVVDHLKTLAGAEADFVVYVFKVKLSTVADPEWDPTGVTIACSGTLQHTKDNHVNATYNFKTRTSLGTDDPMDGAELLKHLLEAAKLYNLPAPSKSKPAKSVPPLSEVIL